MNNSLYNHSRLSKARLSNRRHMRGLTFIELIVTIVILGVAATGILYTMTINTQNSADPMVQEQAILIAEAYIEEVLQKYFLDPDTAKVCPPPDSGGRNNYNNVCDYYNLNDTDGARNQFGVLIPGLEKYNVSVRITPNPSNMATINLNGITNDFVNNIIRILRVDVSVTHDEIPGVVVPLSTYRTSYACNIAADAGCEPFQ